jgi:hypothetical protein
MVNIFRRKVVMDTRFSSHYIDQALNQGFDYFGSHLGRVLKEM